MERYDNIQRSIKRVYEIIELNKNDFSLYVIISFKKTRVNAKDADDVMKKLHVWLSNLVQRKGLKYILVPELHESGRIHAHMICNNVFNFKENDSFMVVGYEKPLTINTIKRYNIPKNNILEKVLISKDWLSGNIIGININFNVNYYADRIVQYIDRKKIFGRRYWCSKNIKLYNTDIN